MVEMMIGIFILMVITPRLMILKFPVMQNLNVYMNLKKLNMKKMATKKMTTKKMITKKKVFLKIAQ